MSNRMVSTDLLRQRRQELKEQIEAQRKVGGVGPHGMERADASCPCPCRERRGPDARRVGGLTP